MEYKNVEQAMELHKKLYDGLSKMDAFDLQTFGLCMYLGGLKSWFIHSVMGVRDHVEHCCFLCDYAQQQVEGKEIICEHCPVYSSGTDCMGEGQPYKRAFDIFSKASRREEVLFTMKEAEELKKIFAEISELKVKED